ncbi:MAG: endonuclease III [Chloroflexi bacterium]|nr:endonuclease III [Chloroflexota bacterium]
MATVDIRAKIQAVYEALERCYGHQVWKAREKPLDELILTVLSQHTSDQNSGQAFESLRKRFRTWEEVRDADEEELADAIRSGGLANIKARRIKDILRLIWEERGDFDLGSLASLPLDEAKSWLTALPGVGPKTAAVVLLFSLGRPAMPVDTHVYRVSRRVGLIGPKVSADLAHEILEGLLEPRQVYSFHLNMIRLGREVCKAQRPRHEVCVLAPYCDYLNQGL